MIRITKNTPDQVTFEKDTREESWFNYDCSYVNLLKQCNREGDKIKRIQFDDGKHIGSILYVYFDNKKPEPVELPTEIKAKVIAQYIGQMCETMTRQTQGEGKPSKYLKGQLKEIDTGMYDSFIGVLLENETEPSNHTNYNTNQCKLILKPLSKITDEDALEIQRIYDGDKYFNTHTGIDDFVAITRGKQFANDPFLNYEAYQYLISKGYDIKHRLLGGLTLQQAGLAIYKEDEEFTGGQIYGCGQCTTPGECEKHKICYKERS